MLNGEKLKIFPVKSGTREGCPLRPFVFNTVLEVLATAIREEKEIKVSQTGREEVKPSLYTDDIILYREKTVKTTQKQIALINSARRNTQNNIQKLDAFLNAHNDISERESRKQSKTALKNLEINLTKEVKDLYTKSQHC